MKEYKERISNSSNEELTNILKEVRADSKLSKKEKQKLKTKILNISNGSREVINDLKNDKNPVIKWLAYDYENSKPNVDQDIVLDLKS